MFKKILAIITIIIITTSLTSCKKNQNLDYKYIGVYLEVIDVSEKSISDRNIKLYFEVDKNNKFTSYNGIYEYQIHGTSLVNDIKEQDGVIKYTLGGRYEVNGNLDVVHLYPIVYGKNGYKVLTNEQKTLKLEKGVEKSTSIIEEYRYDDKMYKTTISIKMYKK